MQMLMACESWPSTAAEMKHQEAAWRRKLDRRSVNSLVGMAVDNRVNSHVDIGRGCSCCCTRACCAGFAYLELLI
jgi:hypothetical protein